MPPPRTEVYLIDIQRLFHNMRAVEFSTAEFHPSRVTPFVAVNLPVNGRGFRRALHRHAVGVCFIQLLRTVADEVLVQASFGNNPRGDSAFPDSAARHALHRIAGSIPTAEIPHHRYAVGIRRPDAEGYRLPRPVRSEVFIGFLTRPLMKIVRREIIFPCLFIGHGHLTDPFVIPVFIIPFFSK